MTDEAIRQRAAELGKKITPRTGSRPPSRSWGRWYADAADKRDSSGFPLVSFDPRESAAGGIFRVDQQEIWTWMRTGDQASGSSLKRRLTCSETPRVPVPTSCGASGCGMIQGLPAAAEFWYVVYHALFWLDLYLSGAVEGFAPPAPFTLDGS